MFGPAQVHPCLTDVRRPRPPAHLRADVRERAQSRPGVYRMVGAGGELLYVGKSVRVRARLLSYFRAPPGEKAAEILAHTHHLEWEYVSSEFAALLREMRLIRAHRPPFNVQHKRDRAFCFIKVTREEAPRLLTVFEVGDGAAHFGPFQGPLRVRELVREVSDILELRDCARSTPVRFADQLDLFDVQRTPLCLRADVGRCLAPCAGRCTRGDYRDRVATALSFLEGNADRPLAILRTRMERASAALNFEYAATLRDRIARLQMARDELVALRGIMESLSFVYQPRAWPDAPQHVYLVRRGVVHEEWPAPRTDVERQRLVARATTLFRRRQSTAAVQPVQAAEILLLARWFRLRPQELENVWDDPRPGAREGLSRLRGIG